MMKKYLISSAIAWSIYLMICIGVCIFFWRATDGTIVLQMIPSFALFLYNVYTDIKFFRKYGWDA